MTVVEAAFALPIMLTFIFGLVDLGMWTLNANQATNAARDGARAAIIDFEQADVVGSAHHTAVVAAVNKHLDRTADTITVSCVRPDDTAIACAGARVDLDRIRVEAAWDWTLITPVAAILGYSDGRAEGSATMHIVGRPVAGSSTPTPEPTTTTTTEPDPATTTTTTPAACALTTFTVAPNPVDRSKNGASQLGEPLVVTFTTNGSAACADLRVRIVPTKDPSPINVSCGCGDGPTSFSYTYTGSQNVWKDGTGTVFILNGTTVLGTRTFLVT